MAPRIGSHSFEIDYASSEQRIDQRRSLAMGLTDDGIGIILKNHVGRLAGQTARKRLDELYSTSRMANERRSRQNLEAKQGQEKPNEHPLLLSWDDIFVEDMLGMGSFATVCLVTCPKLRREHAPSHEDEFGTSSMILDDASMTGSMILSYASTTTGGSCVHFDPRKYYACKSLSNKTIQQANVRGFVAAAADLVHEAFLLSHISPHPNIIEVYGIPDIGPERAFQCEANNDNDLGYFIVMEAMAGGSLCDKINEWRQLHALKHRQIERKPERLAESIPGSLENFLASPQEKQHSHTKTDLPHKKNTSASQYQYLPSLEGRIEIALQIASGMQHLHSHGVVFRDLKPQNVGLSFMYPKHKSTATATTVTASTSVTAKASPRMHSRKSHSSRSISSHQASSNHQQPQNLWKLFDFGLAREVTGPFSPSMNATEQPVISGKAGSLRYMSPETMGGKWLRSSIKNAGTGCFSTFASDVYSFGILLWELIGLQDFDRRYDSNPQEFESAVCDHGYRPDIGAVEKAILVDEAEQSSMTGILHRRDLKTLVEACWHEDYRQRPSFEQIVIKLKEMLSSPTLINDAILSQRKPLSARQALERSSRSMGMTLSPMTSPTSIRKSAPRSRRQVMNGSTRSMKLSDVFEDDDKLPMYNDVSLYDSSMMSSMNESFPNPRSYLHDDVYFTLEEDEEEIAHASSSSIMMDASFTELNDVSPRSRSANSGGNTTGSHSGSQTQHTLNGRAFTTTSRSTASSITNFSFSSGHSSGSSSKLALWNKAGNGGASNHGHDSNSTHSYQSAVVA